ncbi:MAG: pncB [Chlamydiales bacterium]|jgi:nicotinate phosphoribosyltransferase|nr:pncB [Chlamydiales bacterium]
MNRCSSLSLLLDFYQLNMAYGCWKSKQANRQAVFHLFFRKNPFKGSFAIACGLEPAIQLLQSFRFTPDDLAYLGGLKGENQQPYFDTEFLNYLKDFRLTASIDAIEEGSLVFPFEPLVRVKGSLIEGILLETMLMNAINFPTLVATKAARMCLAAGGDPVVEFGLRRAQGIDGGMTASRAAFVGGIAATSNVLAGKRFHIPLTGTHAHSWVLLFDQEEEAFETFARSTNYSTVFLVDTYNTIQGIKKAIAVGKKLRQEGRSLDGIRLDSGDLADLSIQARALLDEAGFFETAIVASNALDERVIAQLKSQGAKISVWGVGTSLVTGQDQPALDGVYKLSALQEGDGPWQYKIKLSEQVAKVSNPGILQVRRFFKGEELVADLIFDENAPPLEAYQAVLPDGSLKNLSATDFSDRHEDLLVPIFREGSLVYQVPPLEQVQERALSQLKLFPTALKRLDAQASYPVGMEESLYQVKDALIRSLRAP